MTVEQLTFTDLGRVAVVPAGDPDPPAAGELLLAPTHVGICGSDLAVLTGQHPWVRPPVVTGHEVAARVLAVGAGVTRVEVGALVVLNPLQACGSCARCRAGQVNRCEAAAVRGYRIPGAGVTRLVVREAEVHPVPAEVSPADAALAEPLAVAWHASGRTTGLGDVAVIGAGSVGQLLVSALRARGAGRITIVEPDKGKRELALRRGADLAYAEPPALGGFDAVFDCVARESTLDWAGRGTVAGGTLVVVGVPEKPTRVPLERLQRFEIALLGSGLYTPADLETAIELIATGAVDVGALISVVCPLERAAEAYARAQDPATVKVLIAMQPNAPEPKDGSP